MTKYLNATLLASGLLVAAPAFAADTGFSGRSPADMTVEERTDMMKTASKYDNCVYSQAISKVGDFDDIRQTADFAMGECQDKLTDLQVKIMEMGFHENFANGFSKRVRNRAARKILPELAVRKAGG